MEACPYARDIKFTTVGVCVGYASSTHRGVCIGEYASGSMHRGRHRNNSPPILYSFLRLSFLEDNAVATYTWLPPCSILMLWSRLKSCPALLVVWLKSFTTLSISGCALG
eukprot:4307810-Heterocapsa_arctica.AAC.1